MAIDREKNKKLLVKDDGLLEIIKFAIDMERDAQDLYDDGYRYAKNPAAREMFRLLLDEEIAHEKSLEKIYKEIHDFLSHS